MKGILLALSASLVVTSCPKMTPEGNIVDIVVGVSGAPGTFDDNGDDYDLLREAVLAAELAGALSDPDANYTVFAPKDSAFAALATDLGFAGGTEEEALGFILEAIEPLGGIDLLTEILLYHVADGARGPLRVVFARKIEMLNGGFVRPRLFTLRDNDPGLQDPKLTLPINIKATNGVIHTIDRVLIPANVTGA